MTRWSESSRRVDGEAYAARFAALADSGVDVHGEADLCSALASPPARVLDAGCGHGRVAIELARRGYDVVGVDVDASMLAVARRTGPGLVWVEADLADLSPAEVGTGFDLVVAAGNVVPLLKEGTEASVISGLADLLGPSGRLLAGFGLDAAHLPLPQPPFGLAEYDAWCARAGLNLGARWATWDRQRYDGGGYAVSLHRR